MPRRRFLKLSGAAVAVSAVTLESSSVRAATWQEPEGFTEFMQMSAFLTEKNTLETALGQKIFRGLTMTDPDFLIDMQRLQEQWKLAPIPLKGLQEALDKQDAKLARIPRNIMQAWYLGVVGSGAAAYAVAYEETLMFQPVADVVVLPTFARGVPLYWTETPEVLLKSEGK